jgi:hypothetical protein
LPAPRTTGTKPPPEPSALAAFSIAGFCASHGGMSEAMFHKMCAAGDQPWSDPIFDVAPLLDEIVAEISRYVVAPLPMLNTVALWIALAHLIHQQNLGINISPRLAIQAPDKNCGKSVLLEAVACAVPRPDLVSSTSASAVFSPTSPPC